MPDIPITQEQLSDLIGVAYESAFEERQWEGLLTRLHQLFPEIGGIAYAHDGDTMLPPVAAIRSDGRNWWEDAIRFVTKNTDDVGAFEAMKGVAAGWIARTEKYFDEEAYEGSAIYSEYLQPAGYRHAQHMLLDQREGRGAYIALIFPEDPEAHLRLYLPIFELLKLLSPHCVRAFHLARMVTLTRRSNEALGGFLDAIILPMVVTDGRGRVAFANKAGRRMLDRGNHLAVTDAGDLVLTNAEDTCDMRRAIATVEETLAPGGVRFWDVDDPLLLCLTPFRTTLEDASPLDRHLLEEERLVAIFLSQPPSDAIDTTLLRDMFDLTPREADVCQALLSGQSAIEISKTSGRALKTIRNQIQTLYDKVGVSSNTQLIDALAVFRTVGAMFDETAKLAPARVCPLFLRRRSE